MNTGLSFRKETIQLSSCQSESLGHSLAARLQDQGPGQARDQQQLHITTLLTITQ